MNYLNLPKPHGWLLWRGKKKAIANDTPLPNDKLLVISGDEAYGYVTLASPVAVNISEFERLEDEHLVRREDRKLYWPNADKLYLHRLKDWQPFESTKLYTLQGNEAELVEDVTLTPEQLELIKQAERLPKTLVLLDEAVTLCDGKAVYCDGVSPDKLAPILDVTLDGIKSVDSLPLYQLALVRIPRLSFKQKKSDVDSTEYIMEEAKAMPYQKVKRGDEWCVIQTDTEEVEKCYEGEDAESKADDLLASLRINVESSEGKSVKELIAEARKCYSEGMPMPAMTYGPASFAEWDELEEAQEIASDIQELNYRFSASSSIIFANPEITDKGTALSKLANEYSNRVSQVGSKELDEGEKAEQGGYLVSGEDGNHLPTHKNGKPDHRLMGAAWAALHGGYRGKKYEGPKKAQAIAKLKKLYESEGMDTPGTKELDEGDKVGKRIRQSMKDRLKQAWETIKEVMDWAEPDEDEVSKAFGDSSHFAIKQVNGVPWFMSYSANAFEDREGEIFSTKSLEKYVAEAEELGDKGYFNIWHIGTKTNPGLTDFARIEWQGVIGKFLVEAGPFLDNAKGQAALAFFTEYPESHPDIAPEGWGSSVEYKYLKSERETKVYKNIWKTRTSALPRKVAANTWTKGTIMALSPEQTQAAKAIFGEDLAQQIIKGAEGATKELEEAGVASKEVTTETTTEVVETKVEIDEQALVEKVAKQVGVDFEPIAQALTLIADNQTKQQLALDELAGRIKSLEKTEDVKTATETSRFMVSVLNRASQDSKTIVSDEDPLKEKKPAEQQVKQTGAAAFFPAR
jgi:hypothetical protein